MMWAIVVGLRFQKIPVRRSRAVEEIDFSRLLENADRRGDLPWRRHVNGLSLGPFLQRSPRRILSWKLSVKEFGVLRRTTIEFLDSDGFLVQGFSMVLRLRWQLFLGGVLGSGLAHVSQLVKPGVGHHV